MLLTAGTLQLLFLFQMRSLVGDFAKLLLTVENYNALSRTIFELEFVILKKKFFFFIPIFSFTEMIIGFKFQLSASLTTNIQYQP